MFPQQRINKEKQNNRGTVRHGDILGSPGSWFSSREFNHLAFIREFNDSSCKRIHEKLSVQLWSVSQRTMEAEEVTDS
jgi:hypothetical protein